jgi:hypothetical protein
MASLFGRDDARARSLRRSSGDLSLGPGDEAMNIVRKSQIAGVVKGDIQGQVRFVAGPCGVAA